MAVFLPLFLLHAWVPTLCLISLLSLASAVLLWLLCLFFSKSCSLAPKRKICVSSYTKKWKTILYQEKMDIVKWNVKGRGISDWPCIRDESDNCSYHTKGQGPYFGSCKRCYSHAFNCEMKQKGDLLLIGMEELLKLWIEDNNQRCMPVGGQLICKKAHSVH